MSLTAGARLGPYEILSPLGAGGMGEVYRARDTRLGRDVAIKVLPEAFANDAERLARFQREAQLLASLNHPHIAIIHGLEESGGSRALVMELVEGPTLADRIAQGPIPLDEAFPIARQIAEALEAAHERSVIHRDLKPANIKITPDGQVKVLDFGLAKLVENSSITAGGMTMSPTLSVQATVAGVILGTAAYMSPEQARGKPVDRRADIWAFGCVLFEMLTGERVFDVGETVSDAVAAILKNDPDWSSLPPATPGHIRTLLRRCLQKDVQKRLPHIGLVRIELDDSPPREFVPAEGRPAGRGVRSRERVAWGLAAAAAATLAAIAIPAVRHLRETPLPAPQEIRTDIVTPATTEPTSFALSPDGRWIVFEAAGDGGSRLWLRSITTSSAQPLAGTEGAIYPFWSPDSRSVGFFADGVLKRLDINGGSPRVLIRLPGSARGGSWNADDVILFEMSTGSPIYRVSATGGSAAPVTTLDRQVSHRFPTFLPDGRRFLFFSPGAPGAEGQGIYMGSLDSKDVKLVTSAETAGVYTAAGWLAWVNDGTLVARRLDAEAGELLGEQVTMAENVGFDTGTSAAAVSASPSGLIAYRGGGASRRQLVWFNREGKSLGTLGAADDTYLSGPRLAPDERRVIVWRVVQGNADVWMLDGARVSRFTFDGAFDRFPIWSADGNQILFDSNRTGRRNLYMKPSSGAGTEQVFLESAEDKVASGFSRDGRFLMFQSQGPKTAWDLWVLPGDGDRKPYPFLITNFNERGPAQFSPDDRWVAYSSDESGRYEIYVRPFIDDAGSSGANRSARTAGGQWQVSTDGGLFPRWRADGRELFYIAPDGRMMAASITASDEAPDVGTPRSLFSSRIWGAGTSPDISRQYDVTRDGRFLINTVLDEIAAPITILQNWNPERR